MYIGRTVVHGIYTLCYLSRQPTGQLASASAVAEAVGVPPEHTRKILSALAAADLVRSVRGRAGGFALARPLPRITVLDVRDAVQSADGPVDPVDPRHCPVAARDACCVGPGLRELRAAIRALLAARTLDELVGEDCRGSAAEVRRAGRAAFLGVSS